MPDPSEPTPTKEASAFDLAAARTASSVTSLAASAGAKLPHPWTGPLIGASVGALVMLALNLGIFLATVHALDRRLDTIEKKLSEKEAHDKKIASALEQLAVLFAGHAHKDGKLIMDDTALKVVQIASPGGAAVVVTLDPDAVTCCSVVSEWTRTMPEYAPVRDACFVELMKGSSLDEVGHAAFKWMPKGRVTIAGECVMTGEAIRVQKENDEAEVRRLSASSPGTHASH